MKRSLRSWLWRVPLDQEVDEEIAFHVDMRTRELVERGGMDPTTARGVAIRGLGNVENLKRRCVDLGRKRDREMRVTQWLEELSHDVKFAGRQLRSSPTFTLVATITLALGIGANTAIFSLISAVLLRPLPFPDPDRLVLIWDDFSARGASPRVEPTPADYVAWKEQSHSFVDMAAFVSGTYNLTGEGDPEKLAGVRTTANLFAVLGMQPLLGRTLAVRDDEPAANPVVVLTEGLWRTRFGADPGLVGRPIRLNGLPHTVVGIVPAQFQFPVKNATLWVPARFTPKELAEGVSYFYDVLGRLKPTVTLGQARAEMKTIARRLAQEHPRSNADVGIAVTPLHEHLTRTARPALLILLGAVGLVLLIACANVANLLLARGAGRQKELALRKALGAGHGRVLRQLLTESLVLAALGVVFGVALSTLSFAYLARLVPNGLPQGTSPGLDARVLAFTAAVAMLIILGFGTGPALASTHVDLDRSLRTGTGRGTTTPSGRRLRSALVVAEMTLTVMLLVAAGLLLRSYAQVLAVDPGFQPQNLLIAETILSPVKYATIESRSAFYQGVLERVKVLPGVSSAGYVNYPPLVFKGGRAFVTIEGRPEPSREDFTRFIVSDRVISEGYFSMLRVPLIIGRQFDQRDGPDSPLAVIINDKMAHMHWPDENPVGHRLKIGAVDYSNPWFTIVGVVGDMRQMGLDTPAESEMYFALRQSAWNNGPFFWPQHLLVRTQSEPLALSAAVRHAVWDVDEAQSVSNIRSMSQVFDAELLNRNIQMTLVGAFAVLALLMASVGLYGVLSYSVAQRTREIGVRMALGAQRGIVVGGIVREALLLATLGIVLGLGAAFVLTRLLTTFLFGVSPTDPATFFAVSLLLVLVATVASFVPARRAADVDPVSVLRTD